jgi:hypothetical protein
MLDLKSQILRMYADIADYEGDFGDGVDHGDYDPYSLIHDLAHTEFERTGVSVAILVYLETAIDNSTWEAALVSQGPLVKPIIQAGLLDHQPLIRSAAMSFLKSEAAFHGSLNLVFDAVVRPQLTA